MRVLIARLSAMGDVVHGIAAVRALCVARPEWEVAWVVQRPLASLIEGIGLARIHVFDRGHGPRAFLRTAAAVRAWRPEIALDLQGNWKSASLCLSSGARRRIGTVRALRSEPSSAWMLNERIAVPGDSRHPADVALALVRYIEPGVDPQEMPVLDATAEACAREREVIAGLGVDPDRPFRLVVVADQRDHRAIRGSALLRECAAAKEPVLALAGPDDEQIDVPDRVPVLRHGRGELARLRAVGRIALEAGAIVIGPDKGATHVLCACGARTVVVHGPTDPERTSPRGATVLRTSAPPSCMPCDARSCSHPQGPVCMDVATCDPR